VKRNHAPLFSGTQTPKAESFLALQPDGRVGVIKCGCGCR